MLSEAERTGKPVYGVKGTSVLSEHINIPHGYYIHPVLDGVVKNLLKLWFSSKSHNKPYCLRPYTALIDKNLQSLKPPHDGDLDQLNHPCCFGKLLNIGRLCCFMLFQYYRSILPPSLGFISIFDDQTSSR